VNDHLIQLAAPDADGIIYATVNGMPLGEIVKSTPRTWNLDEHRGEVTTFYEAIDLDGRFLDPVFTTAEAAAVALATLAGIRTTRPSSHERHH
jgi:transposase-like protein